MNDPASVDRARQAVQAEHEAHDAWKAALKARDEAVRDAFLANRDLGPTALGNAIGLNSATLRGLTRHLKE